MNEETKAIIKECASLLTGDDEDRVLALKILNSIELTAIKKRAAERRAAKKLRRQPSYEFDMPEPPEALSAA